MAVLGAGLVAPPAAGAAYVRVDQAGYEAGHPARAFLMTRAPVKRFTVRDARAPRPTARRATGRRLLVHPTAPGVRRRPRRRDRRPGRQAAEPVARFNGNDGRFRKSRRAVYRDNVESYSTTDPAIDLTATSFLAFSWRMLSARRAAAA